MRQGQPNHHNNNNNNKNRMRGRNRKGPNPLTRSYESNGGDVKIRGTALHVAEKYVQLARDAQSSGDRVAGENYLQHAEHYYRIVAAAQAQMPQPQQVFRNDEEGDEEEGGENRNGFAPNQNFGGNFGNNNNYGGNNQGSNRPQLPPGGQPASGEPQGFGNGAGEVNGGGQDQPQFDNSGQGNYAPNEQRNEGYDNRDRGYGNQGGNQGNNFRGGRRRRPYRDHYNNNDRGGEQRAGGTGPENGPEPADTGTPPDQSSDE